MTKEGLRIYEDADFAGMAIAGKLAAELLDEFAALITVGS